MAAGAIAAPVGALMSSGFDNVNIRGIVLDITSSEDKRSATLERISLDATDVVRGENVEVQAYVRTDSGKQFVERIPVQIPADAPAGQLMIMVGDGVTLQESSSARACVPRDPAPPVGLIISLSKKDRVSVCIL